MSSCIQVNNVEAGSEDSDVVAMLQRCLALFVSDYRILRTTGKHFSTLRLRFAGDGARINTKKQNYHRLIVQCY